jgi:membrane-associated protease RseP (regulator of RpoE activity)
MHNKSGADKDRNLQLQDCIAVQTKYWFWVLAVLIAGSVIYAITASYGQRTVYSSVAESFPQGGQFQTIAVTKCPYCSGFLDAQGRCNMKDCPLYSSNWGKPSNVEGIPVKKVLIKELALEVAASQGKSSVIIQSVYIGGNAEKASLKAGDRIVRFNGRKAKNVKQFQSAVALARPESNVNIEVVRNGEKVKSAVFVGEGEMEGVTIPTTPDSTSKPL